MATPVFYPNSKYAVGFNNAGGLTAWESTADSNGVRFFPPTLYGLGDPGQRRYRLGGHVYHSGYAISGILFFITQEQRYYIYNTLCSNSYDGEFTLQFRYENPATYIIANTIIEFDKLVDSNKQSRAFIPYKGRCRKLVIIG